MDFLVSYCLDAVIVFGNKKVSTLQVPSKNNNFEWLHNTCTFQLTFIHSRASSRVQRSIFRAARTYFRRTRRYLDSKFAMMKYAIQDLMQTLKQEITVKKIKAKIQENQDNGGYHLHLFLNPFVYQFFHWMTALVE